MSTAIIDLVHQSGGPFPARSPISKSTASIARSFMLLVKAWCITATSLSILSMINPQGQHRHQTSIYTSTIIVVTRTTSICGHDVHSTNMSCQNQYQYSNGSFVQAPPMSQQQPQYIQYNTGSSWDQPTQQQLYNPPPYYQADPWSNPAPTNSPPQDVSSWQKPRPMNTHQADRHIVNYDVNYPFSQPNNYKIEFEIASIDPLTDVIFPPGGDKAHPMYTTKWRTDINSFQHQMEVFYHRDHDPLKSSHISDVKIYSDPPWVYARFGEDAKSTGRARYRKFKWLLTKRQPWKTGNVHTGDGGNGKMLWLLLWKPGHKKFSMQNEGVNTDNSKAWLKLRCVEDPNANNWICEVEMQTETVGKVRINGLMGVNNEAEKLRSLHEQVILCMAQKQQYARFCDEMIRPRRKGNSSSSGFPAAVTAVC